MSALGTLTVSLTMDTLEFTKGIDRSSNEAQKFQQKLERNLNKAIGEVKGSMAGLGAQAAALAAGFIGVSSAAQAFVDKINSMDRLTDVSAKIGATVESLSALQFAAQLSGSSAEELEKGLVQLNKAAAAAAGGVGEQAEAFRALGVSVLDSNGKIKSTEKLLLEASDRFSKLSDGADKTAVAMQLFGKAGADLVPFLNNGAQGIKDLTEEAKLFGAIVGTDAAESAAKFNDNLDKLKAVSGGVAKEIASSLLPSINEYTEKALLAFKTTGSLTGALTIFLNESVNFGDPSKRVRDLNDELERGLKTLKAYQNSNLRGTVFESSAQANVDAVQAQLRYNQQLQLREIDEANKPPPNSAAARQRIQNEQDAKDAADKALRAELQAAEARKQAAAEEAEIRKNTSAAMKLLLADMANYAEATQKQLELERQASREAANYRADEVDRIDARRFAIEREIEQVEFETLLIGKSADEIARLTAEREAESIAILEQDIAFKRLLPGRESEIEAIEREIDARKKLASARGANAAAQEAQRAVDAQNRVYEDLYRDISRGLTDSIFRGFESGKKFITSFKDAIRNAFKSFIIKFAVQPLIGSAIGGIASSLGFSGLAQAATKELGSFGGIGDKPGSIIGGGFGGGSSGGGFGLSEAGGLKSIYDGIAGGISNLSISATQAGYRLSELAGASVETSAAVGNFAGAATTAAAAAGIAYGGYSLGRGISGGYSLNGGTGNSTVNVGAAVGVGTAAMISQATAAAGGAAFGPVGYAVGAALGAILGGTVNKLFGSKRVLGASGIEGEFADGQFVGRTFQDVQIKRKLRSDKSFTQFGSIDGNTLNLLADSFQALTDSAKSTTRVLGKDLSAAIDAVRISGRFQISTQEQFKATLDRLSDEIIKQTIPAVEAFRQTGENLIQTAARLSAAVTTANTTAVLLGQPAQFGIDNAAAALSLQANLGDQASQLEGVLSQFVPAAVLARRQLEVFRTSLRNIGLDTRITTDITREQFGALLEQIDLTSEAGQRELATLLSLAPVVSQMIQRREAEKAATEQTNAVLDRLIRGVSGTTNAFVDADAAINQTRLALFNATDIQTRLGLEAQLGQQIVARYELEMQLLGALQAGLSELQVNIGGERGNTQGAIANIVGTPLQMSAQQISQAISGAASLAQLPSLDGVSAASASVAQREAALASIAGAQQSLSSANAELNNSVSSAKTLVTSFNNLSRIGSAFATTGSGARTSARFDETLRQIIRDEYAYITYNIGDENSVYRLREQFNPVFDAVGGANQRISSATSEVARLQSIIASEPEVIRALEASQRALADAKKEFADGIQAFVIDAGRAVTRLSKLREETVKYFEAQKQLSDLMTASAQGIRSTISSIRFADLSPVDQLRNLQNQFAGAFAAAQGASGSALASAGDTLNSLIEPLLSKAAEVFASGAEFQGIRESVLSQAETIAAKLEELAPKNFQEESVILLTQIDAQLAAIEQSASTAEKLIVDAINLSRDRTLDGLRGVVSAIRGEPVQAFANGGFFGGGMRLVGERGPELEVTGPSRIFSAQQTRNIMSGGADVAAEIRALRQDMAQTGNINLKVVTPDGRVMAEQTIREIKERSRKGELVIYADGVSR